MGHWYNQNTGRLVRELPSSKKGVMVLIDRITIAHARKHGLLYSPSFITKTRNKCAYENAKIMNGIRMAHQTPAEQGETEDDWMNRVLEIVQNEASLAMSQGTQWHSVLAKYLDGECRQIFDPIMEKAAVEIGEKVKDAVVEEEFANGKLGFGGTIDWYTEKTIGDHKTTNLSKSWKPKYLDGVKLAFYAMGKGLHDHKMVNDYIDRQTGEVRWIVWGEESRWKETTKWNPVTLKRAALLMYEECVIANNYDPRSDDEEEND